MNQHNKNDFTVNLKLNVGNDCGNSEHDMVINAFIIKQPNVNAKLRTLPELNQYDPSFVLENIHDNLIVTINKSAATNIKSIYVGNYAIKSGKMLSNIEVGASNSKVNSEVIVDNTLAQIAGFAAKAANRKNQDVKSVYAEVDMTTSLPVTQYNKMNARIFRDKFLSSTHELTVHAGERMIEVYIKFDYVRVLPESVPIIFYLKCLQDEFISNITFKELKNMLQHDKKILYESFNKDAEYFINDIRTLHVSIGEGTTELPLTEGIKFDPNFIQGLNNGVGHAIEANLQEFIIKKSLRKFTRQDFSKILKDENHKWYSDAVEIIQDSLNSESDVILRQIRRELEKANNQVDMICVHGGGSILMREDLYNELERISNNIGSDLLYIPAELAVELEAKGLFMFTLGEIYELSKNLYKNSIKELN